MRLGPGLRKFRGTNGPADTSVGNALNLGNGGRLAWRAGCEVLPAEFAEPVVIDAEVVGDLVDDGPADLVGDLLLGLAGRTDLPAVDGDPVGQHPPRSLTYGW
jgi:hypothetical protein